MFRPAKLLRRLVVYLITTMLSAHSGPSDRTDSVSQLDVAIDLSEVTAENLQQQAGSDADYQDSGSFLHKAATLLTFLAPCSYLMSAVTCLAALLRTDSSDEDRGAGQPRASIDKRPSKRDIAAAGSTSGARGDSRNEPEHNGRGAGPLIARHKPAPTLVDRHNECRYQFEYYVIR